MIILIDGGQKGWTDYVLRGTDIKPRDNEKIIVLDGDLELNQKIYQSTNYKNNYTKGVISFNKNFDTETIKNIFQDFKTMFMKGYDEDEYSIASILHLDTDHQHIHFNIPKLNLLTGTCNDYYVDKFDRNRLNLIRDYLNLKYGDGDPKQEKELRLKHDTDIINEHKEEFINEFRKQYGQQELKKSEVKEVQEKINEFMKNGVDRGFITNFQDVKTILEKEFEFKIEKEGWDGNFIDKEKNEYEVNYWYLNLSKNQQKLKLKGDIYGEYKGIWGHSIKSEQRNGLNETTRTRDNENVRGLETTTNQSNSNDPQGINKQLQDIKSRIQKSDVYRVRKLQKRISAERKNDIRRNRNQYEQQEQEVKNRNNPINNINNNSININEHISVSNEVSEYENHRNERKTISTINNQGGINDISKSNPGKNKINEIIGTEGKRGFIENVKRLLSTTGKRLNDNTEKCRRNLSIITNGVSKMNKQLEKYKTEISLVDFIQSLGGAIDTTKSTKNSCVIDYIKDKLVVKKNDNNHYIYFNLNNNRDNGTIIDFIQNRNKNMNFQSIMTTLFNFMKKGYIPSIKLNPTEKSEEEFENYSYTLDPIDKPNIKRLEELRGIDRTIIEEFKSVIKIDNKKNFVFPLYKKEEGKELVKVGYELKNKGFKGNLFEKGIWGQKIGNSSDYYVFESSIDAMSYRELTQDEGFYTSLNGSYSPQQIETLKNVIKSSKSKNVILCLDNDQKGREMTVELYDILSKDTNLNITYTKPIRKDWNGELSTLKFHEELREIHRKELGDIDWEKVENSFKNNKKIEVEKRVFNQSDFSL